MRSGRTVAILLALCLYSHMAYGRTWKDSTGRELEADYLGIEGGNVRLKRSSDGQVFLVPVEKLSSADQEYVKSQKANQATDTSITELAKPSSAKEHKGISIDEYLAELSKEEFSIDKMFPLMQKAVGGNRANAFIFLTFVPAKSRPLLTDADTIPVLKEIMIRGNANARCWAIFFAQFPGKQSPEKVIPEQLILLSDGDYRVRKLACCSLFAFAISEKLTDESAIEAMLKLVNDKNPDVQAVAEVGIATLIEKRRGGDWKKYLDGMSPIAAADFPHRDDAKRIIEKSPRPDSPLPKYSQNLDSGLNPFCIRNPNDFDVWVGLRAKEMGRDFLVRASSQETIYVPNNTYSVLFHYQSDLYEGDTITLDGIGAEIHIVKAKNGNYNIRPSSK